MLLPPIGGTTHTTIRSRVIAVGERIDEEIRQEITENRKPDKVAQQMVITQQTSNTVVSGNVVSQDQPSGSSVAQGSPVNLVISSGPEIVSVPNVEGLTQAAATAAITAAKLTVGTVTQQTSDSGSRQGNKPGPSERSERRLRWESRSMRRGKGGTTLCPTIKRNFLAVNGKENCS